MWVPSVSLVQRQGESKGLWGLGGTHGREDRLASGRPGCQSPTSPPGSPRPQTQASEGLRSLWTDGHSPPSGPPLHPLAEAPLSVCHSLLRPPPTLPGPEDVMAGMSCTIAGQVHFPSIKKINHQLNICLLISKREEQMERVREKHQCERETLIRCLPYICQLGLTGYGDHNLLFGMMLQQTKLPVQGPGACSKSMGLVQVAPVCICLWACPFLPHSAPRQ